MMQQIPVDKYAQDLQLSMQIAQLWPVFLNVLKVYLPMTIQDSVWLSVLLLWGTGVKIIHEPVFKLVSIKMIPILTMLQGIA